MWIVKLALRRPYTFIVAALLLLIISPVVILRTPTDIFPNINIPVVAIVWQYTGLSAHLFEGNITWPYERTLTTTVNDIEHIESQTMNGISVVKVFFQPNAQLPAALAQVTAISQTVLKSMPAGVTPPLVISYNASSVPVLQLGLSSSKLSEQQLNDIAMNFVRPQLATVPAVAIPWPYGGKIRQMMVDIDPGKLNAYGISPTDVTNAINAENLVLPSGTAKIGSLEYDVEMNGSPLVVDALNNLPIKTVNGAVVYVRDVAHVRDGFQVQTNIVRQDGQRGSLLSAYKTGGASTLDIVAQFRAALPRIAAGLPPELRIQPLFDQSLFVRAAVEGVIKEAVIAACLTAVMILLFLGNFPNPNPKPQTPNPKPQTPRNFVSGTSVSLQYRASPHVFRCYPGSKLRLKAEEEDQDDQEEAPHSDQSIEYDRVPLRSAFFDVLSLVVEIRTAALGQFLVFG